jgi:hypothetical protein
MIANMSLIVINFRESFKSILQQTHPGVQKVVESQKRVTSSLREAQERFF